MESYKEYPVRCKSCGEQIAAFADDFEQLLATGSTIEEALNMLGIMALCSRRAMMNPTTITYNMENRQAIEGLKPVEMVSFGEPEPERSNQTVFSPCISSRVAPVTTTAPQPKTAIQAQLPIPQPKTAVQAQLPIPQPQTVIQAQLPIPQPQTVIQAQLPIPQPKTAVQAQPILANEGLLVSGLQPLTAGPSEGDILKLGKSIPGLLQAGEYEEPTMVGIPTINEPPAYIRESVFVGTDKYTHVLGGRTYLAR